ncbi:MAG: DNA methyltransferase [Acidobacteriota bacterium]
MTTQAKQLPLFEELTHKDLATVESEERNQRPETYKGRYAMHKYWSKKPYNLVARYIEHNSRSGDIVLDPFCGSGVTVIEGVRLERRAIGIDINPIAILSTAMGLEHVDTKAVRRCFDRLRKEVAEEIDKLYRAQCPRCKDPGAIATHTIWEDGQPKEMWVECKACKTSKGIKAVSEKNEAMIEAQASSPFWYPTDELIENNRINAKRGVRVCDLFTPRALYGLSLIMDRIRRVEDEKVRSVLEFCFSAALPQTSKMVFVIRRRGKASGQERNGRPEVGSWVIGYWMPREHFEIHVWRCFENRFRRVLKGKEEINRVMPSRVQSCVSFDELRKSQQGYLVSKGTATNLPIPSESIDYIFTDPPHGNRIPYLELSLIWNAWLGLDFEWESEIVVSEAKSRGKGAKDYQDRLETAFREMWRVLKPKRLLSVAFNSLDDDTWLSLLTALLEAGFEIVEIAPLEYSARSVIQDTRQNALKTDFVITSRKQTPQVSRAISISDSSFHIEKMMRSYLSAGSGGAATYEILNHMLISTIPGGLAFKVSTIMETLENICIFSNGQWRLKKS